MSETLRSIPSIVAFATAVLGFVFTLRACWRAKWGSLIMLLICFVIVYPTMALALALPHSALSNFTENCLETLSEVGIIYCLICLVASPILAIRNIVRHRPFFMGDAIALSIFALITLGSIF